MSKTGLVSEIQHFSISDGEGIRTTVFLQGCNLHCKWCHNPETISMSGSVLRYRMSHSETALPYEEKISGRKMTVEAVMKSILEDVNFYEASGGGVTLSGGEPLLQSDFCLEICQQCKEQGISVIVDTAGDVPYENFEKVLPYVKTFLYDLKATGEEDYKKYTGGHFERIRNNLYKLIQAGQDVIVRIPVIPGHNDTPEYMVGYGQILQQIGADKVSLLPFHRLGSSKYEALEQKYEYADIPSTKPCALKGLKEVLEQYGLQVQIEE